MDSSKIDISDKLKDLRKITKFDEFKKKLKGWKLEECESAEIVYYK